jgi:hypothetical protein
MRDLPPLIHVRPGRGKIIIAAGLVLAAAGAALLFIFDPARHGFFPRCFFRLITGWDCPGCGGLRATHQLLHGHVSEAFALNPLFILALPFAAYYAARFMAQRFWGRKLPALFRSTAWIWVAAAVVVTFGVTRNLPWRSWLNG